MGLCGAFSGFCRVFFGFLWVLPAIFGMVKRGVLYGYCGPLSGGNRFRFCEGGSLRSKSEKQDKGRKKQIPFGDDKQKGNGKGRGDSNGNGNDKRTLGDEDPIGDVATCGFRSGAWPTGRWGARVWRESRTRGPGRGPSRGDPRWRPVRRRGESCSWASWRGSRWRPRCRSFRS